jgi:HSP20 family protein
MEGGLKMNLIRYRPNRYMSIMDDSWDNWFRSFFNDFPKTGSNVPDVDIKENEKGYVIEVELPGLSEKDIEVKVEGNLLTLSSKKNEKKEEKKDDYILRERRSFEFSRSFVIPDNVDGEKISAEFNNGLLSLNVPKTEKAKPKLLEINVK